MWKANLYELYARPPYFEKEYGAPLGTCAETEAGSNIFAWNELESSVIAIDGRVRLHR